MDLENGIECLKVKLDIFLCPYFTAVTNETDKICHTGCMIEIKNVDFLWNPEKD